MGCDVDWSDLSISFTFGFGAGALMPALGTKAIGAAAVGGVFGAAQDIVGSLKNHEPINPTKTLASAGIGMLGGVAPWKNFATWPSKKYPEWAAAGNHARMVHANPAIGVGATIGISGGAIGEVVNTRGFSDGCSCK